MKGTFNPCFYGYLVLPILQSCERFGLFQALREKTFSTESQLQQRLKQPAVQLQPMLSMMVEAGVVERNQAAGYRKVKGIDLHLLRLDLSCLYDLNQLRRGEIPQNVLTNIADLQTATLQPLSELLFGAICTALLLASAQDENATSGPLPTASAELQQLGLVLFQRRQWLDAGTDLLSADAQALLQSPPMTLMKAYQPMLLQLLRAEPELAPPLLWHQVCKTHIKQLLAAYQRVFYPTAADDLLHQVAQRAGSASGREPYRAVVVFGEAGGYAAEILQVLSHVITNSADPLHLLLVKDDDSLLPGPIDPREHVGVSVVVIDRLNADAMVQAIHSQGFTPAQSLLVGSFTQASADFMVHKAQVTHADIITAQSCGGYRDESKQSEQVVAGWKNYLSDWTRKLPTDMIVLEPHCLHDLRAQDADVYWQFFDWAQKNAGWLPLSAQAWLQVTAAVGLFNPSVVRSYPRSSDFTHLSVTTLEKRTYQIRPALPDDLATLSSLEQLCWSHSRTPEAQLQQRLTKYPAGHFVLTLSDTVIGVIYSQRIDRLDRYEELTCRQVHQLHNPSGHIIQLLAVNVDPAQQAFGFGDQLLEFMLQRCALMTGINQVVGVTLCTRYNAKSKGSFADYIHLTGAQQDPVLAFHASHGAQIVRLIQGYRPEDPQNDYAGILVNYDIHHRLPLAQQTARQQMTTAAPLQMTDLELEQAVVELLATVLDADATELDAHQPLMEMGLCSAGLLRLQQQVKALFAIDLAASFFFEYNTISKVIGYLRALIAKPPAEMAASVATDTSSAVAAVPNRHLLAPTAAATDIAIIGVACRLPGQIHHVDDLWQVLITEQCVIGTYPTARGAWPTSVQYPGIEHGGFLPDGDQFAASFFRISPLEASLMDPQQRLLLELAWHCLEDAAITPAQVAGSDTGVFIGASNCDYSRLLAQMQQEAEAHQAAANSLAVIANRLSYFFDLTGPSTLVDTACSASLVAVHQAISALRNGECQMALAGGVNFICHPDLSVSYHKAGMLAPDGRCKVFDQSANGYVRAEGAVLFLLKPLANAVADRDPIYALIKGSAVNHGGLASGLTVPNPQKQSELLQKAWHAAGIHPQHISYLEAHGTGTSLGDPIEIDGMQRAFQAVLGADEPLQCRIGSVKSNLGHLESAAGAVGMLKIIAAMQQDCLPATINFQQLNHQIRLDMPGLQIQQTASDWPASAEKIAGVSSFGSGGSNAHVVLQSWPAPAVTVTPAMSALLVLSARSAASLNSTASQLVNWLSQHQAKVSFNELLYSLQVGRTAMEHRLVLRVGSLSEAVVQLKLWLSGQQGSGQSESLCWNGVAEKSSSPALATWRSADGQQLLAQLLQERDECQLAMLWVQGVSINWQHLYSDAHEQPNRIAGLPGYPFERQRFWPETELTKPDPGLSVAQHADAGGCQFLHPLLHQNSSDWYQQSYQTTLEATEYYLRDHQVLLPDALTPQPVLPGAAYLELCCAAVADAFPKRSLPLSITDVIWHQPCLVSTTQPLRIKLHVPAVEEDAIQCHITVGAPAAEMDYCQATVMTELATATTKYDIEHLRTTFNASTLSVQALYSALATMGLHYGGAFQTIHQLWTGHQQLFVALQLPAALQTELNRYLLHPAILDGAIQAAVALACGFPTMTGRAALPFALERLDVFAPCSPTMYALVTDRSHSAVASRQRKLDILLLDAAGQVCAQLTGLTLRTPAQVTAPKSLLGPCVFVVPSLQQIMPSNPVQSAQSQHVIVVRPAADAAQIEEQAFITASAEVLAVGYYPLMDTDDVALQYRQFAGFCFQKIQHLLTTHGKQPHRLQILIPAEPALAYLAGIIGMLNTATLENPNFSGQLIQWAGPWHAKAIAAAITQSSTYTQTEIQLTGNLTSEVVTCNRWQLAKWQPTTETIKLPYKEGGTYLITGGLGGLGRLLALEILARTATATVVLTGRAEMDPTIQQQLEALMPIKDRARLHYVRLDLTSDQQVATVLSDVRQQFGALTGIFHAAGQIKDSFLLKKTAADFDQVLLPKTTGTVLLDKHSRDDALDFLVLFSSFTAVLGNSGQADYSCANGFMDRFAQMRNQQVLQGLRHGHTLAMNWPLWQQGGMQMDEASYEVLFNDTGMAALSTEAGWQAMYHCLQSGQNQVMVLTGDQHRLEAMLTADNPIASGAIGVADSLSPVHKATIDATQLDLQAIAHDCLCRLLATELKLPLPQVDINATLDTYGIDSILVTRLTKSLETHFGKLPKTLFFEYLTLAELAGYLVECHADSLRQMQSNQPSPSRPAAQGQVEPLSGATQLVSARSINSSSTTNSTKHSRLAAAIASSDISCTGQVDLTASRQPAFNEKIQVAVIGLSGRYPGGSDVNAYWENLSAGLDCVTEVPADRWLWQDYYSTDRTLEGRHYSKWGGFISGIDEFDAQFFNVSPRDAKYMDPQERLFLQHAFAAFEDAGYTKQSLQITEPNDIPAQVGVYVGVMWSHYQLLCAAEGGTEQRMAFAGNPASIANRVSYFMNLHGPSITVDTMCSSSLSAVHLACKDIEAGITRLAVAGGVNLTLHPHKYQLLSVGQFIAGSGQCQSFGEGGDGYIPSEGVGAVVLKPLTAAIADGNPIYGVILGSALNHGGKTNGYTVPNPQAQASVVGRVLQDAGVDGRHISYVEAHGTGTKLGDPIEIAGLTKAFYQQSRAGHKTRGYCLIGSAKSNIGHCEAAAGIAGLTKLLLQLKHQQIAPSLHASQLNPNIDFANTPFEVCQQLQPWHQPVIEGTPVERIAALSSFGAGGANAHLLVKEYQAPQPEQVRWSQLLILLSARTAEQLKRKAEQLLQFLTQQPTTDLPSLAYTLQLGREAMSYRSGILVGSREQLLETLQQFVADASNSGWQQAGPVTGAQAERPAANTVAQALNDPAILQQLLQLWLAGVDLDWALMYGQQRPRLISLPTYPFAQDRYWLSPTTTSSLQQSAAVIHPFLHRNESDFGQQRYLTNVRQAPGLLSTKTGELSVGALLEMARKAAQLALNLAPLAKVSLQQLTFGDLKLARDATDVEIVLSSQQEDSVSFEIYSGQAAQKLVHCQGLVSTTVPSPVTILPQPTDTQLELPKFQHLADVGFYPQLFDTAFDGLAALIEQSHRPDVIAAVTLFAAPDHVGMKMLVQAVQLSENQGLQRCPAIAFYDQQDQLLLLIELLDFYLAPVSAGSALQAQSAAPNEVIRQAMSTHSVAATAPYPSDVVTLHDKDVAPVAVPSRQISFSAKILADIGSTDILPVELEATEQLRVPLAGIQSKPVWILPSVEQAVAQARATEMASLIKPAFQLAPRQGQQRRILTDSGSIAAPISLWANGHGHYEIRIDTQQQCQLNIATLSQLLGALQKLSTEPELRLLTLTVAGEALSADRDQLNVAIAAGLFSALMAVRSPVIMGLQGTVSGVGLLIAALCDVVVVAEHSRFHFSGQELALVPTQAEVTLLRARFGKQPADLLLFATQPCSAEQLQQRGLSARVVAADQLTTALAELARNMVDKSALALTTLKQHLTAGLKPMVAKLSPQTCLKASTGAVSVVEIADFAAAVQIQPLEVSAWVIVIPAVADLSGFVQACAQSQVPVIAVCSQSLLGAQWLAVHACDAVIYLDNAHYGLGESIAESEQDIQSLIAIFMAHQGTQFNPATLFESTLVLGAELAKLWHCDSAATLAQALEIAKQRAASLALLCRDSGRLVPASMLVSPQPPAVDDTAVVEPDVLSFTQLQQQYKDCVNLSHMSTGVLLVEMQERSARNMFSAVLVAALSAIFRHIRQHHGYKAIVLTGYDQYFASGGTFETLMAIYHGQAKFTDLDIYHLALDCQVPVISAIQGHAIGAGWSMGMFADIQIYSQQSQYVSPYMGFGFTPGAGVTLIAPQRLGADLAVESLLTANDYVGMDLATRTRQWLWVDQAQVLPQALKVAEQIAKLPRLLLLALKQGLSQPLRSALATTYQQELAMHAITFVGQEKTLTKINAKFRHAQLGAATDTAQQSLPLTAPPAVSTVHEAEMAQKVRALLAVELHLTVAEITDSANFIDLGLDSITGVTWIRKINDCYQLKIEATKVYAYPNLQTLVPYLHSMLMQAQAGEHGSPSVASAPTVLAAGADLTPVSSSNHPAVAQDQVYPQLCKLLAEELHLNLGDIEATAKFIDLGLDSITGVTWVRKINQLFDLNIVATQVYSYPNLATFEPYVLQQINISKPVQETVTSVASHYKPAGAALAAPQRTDTSETAVWQTVDMPQLPRRQVQVLSAQSWRQAKSRGQRSLEPIAVIGMAGQFPGAADVDTFWQQIVQGGDAITEIPENRWSIEQYYQAGAVTAGKTNCKYIGALANFDQFDPLFFNISPVEAESMDPNQRLFLQSCWHAIEYAGYAPSTLAGSRCGVFVGCTQGDYHSLAPELQFTAQGFTGSAVSILAARIAYFLDLQGPCLSIDTACSSSLVAIANACDSLQNGTSDLALAGGVFVMAGPQMHIKSSQAGMLSPDGRCFTFDQRANGFVPGEAVGVLLLKRLSDCSNDQVLAEIRGWNVNQDGKTNGITAPNPLAQARLQQQLYQRFGIDPTEITLIEAHGTGTKLGDPIEIEGLKLAFAGTHNQQHRCALGSVKSQIGHCITAAGVSGMIKLIQALVHQTLPPSIHCQQLNEHIQLEQSPFYINHQATAWQVAPQQRRTAAISSFGFSGTNAHIVLSEARVALQQPRRMQQQAFAVSPSAVIVPLSAQTLPQLQQQASMLAAQLQQQDLPLVSVAYTLQLGRESMPERLALVVSDTTSLRKLLLSFAAGEPLPTGVYQTHIAKHRESMLMFNQEADIQATLLERWLTSGNLAKLAEFWTKGLQLDWQLFYPTLLPQRLRLPVYPFAQERYWLPVEAVTDQLSRGASLLPRLHPLLQRNTSVLAQQRYHAEFDGTEAFLQDHQIADQAGDRHKVLPAVAYLEMARAAVFDGLALTATSTHQIELSHLSWLQPAIAVPTLALRLDLSVVDDAQLRFHIYSEQTGQAQLHCEGYAKVRGGANNSRLDVAALQQRIPQQQQFANSYQALSERGLHYGPSHRCLKTVSRQPTEVLAVLELAPQLPLAERYWLHPGLIDSALQAVTSLLSAEFSTGPIVPFALDILTMYRPCQRELLVWVRSSPQGNSNSARFDLDICTKEGDLVLQMRGLTFRLIDKTTAAVHSASGNKVDPPDFLNVVHADGAFDEEHFSDILNKIADGQLLVDDAILKR